MDRADKVRDRFEVAVRTQKNKGDKIKTSASFERQML